VEITKIKEKGSIGELPDWFLYNIYDFIKNIDLKQADNDIENGDYYQYASDDFPGLRLVVYKNKVVVLCNMPFKDMDGNDKGTKIITTAIPRNELGEIQKHDNKIH